MGAVVRQQVVETAECVTAAPHGSADRCTCQSSGRVCHPSWPTSQPSKSPGAVPVLAPKHLCACICPPCCPNGACWHLHAWCRTCRSGCQVDLYVIFAHVKVASSGLWTMWYAFRPRMQITHDSPGAGQVCLEHHHAVRNAFPPRFHRNTSMFAINSEVAYCPFNSLCAPAGCKSRVCYIALPIMSARKAR
jgi:hypothetical protein